MSETAGKLFDKERDGILLFCTGYSGGMVQEIETSFIQIGILSLGTVLKENGYKVKVLITYYPDMDEIKEFIKKEKIKIVGFYTTTENIFRCFNCSRIIKRAFPDIIIIAGGTHVRIMDKDTLEREETIDLIVRREGEVPLLEIVNYYFQGSGSLKDIKGITYRDGKKIKCNPEAPVIENLDTLPLLDRDLLEEPLRSTDRLYPRIVTARGCPFMCAFCYESSSGSKYRRRSIGNILTEVDYLLERGNLKYLRINDDSFTVDPEFVSKLCRGLKERGGGKKFVWYCEGRFDVLAGMPDLLSEMVESGLANVHTGLECCDQRVLDLYQKGITLEQIEQVVRSCKNAGVPVLTMNIVVGGPLESQDLYKTNLNFVRKIMAIAPGRLMVTTALTIPFPGTRIRNNPEKFGIKIFDYDCRTGLTNETCYAETEFMSKYDLTRYKRNFDREVDKIVMELLTEIPRDLFYKHIKLQTYGVKSNLLHLVSFDKGVKKFFDLKCHKSYLSLDEIDEKGLFAFYPTATYPIDYNSENLVVLDKIFETETLDFTKSRLYEISYGRMSVRDIINFAQNNIFKDLKPEEVKERVLDFYRYMDKIYGVVFSKI